APCDAVADTKARVPGGNWAGSRSEITTAVAGLGPALRATIVKVTWSPMLGIGLSTVFRTPTSARTPVLVVVGGGLLLGSGAGCVLGSGSGSLAAFLVARLVMEPGCCTIAVRTSSALAPFASP